MTRDEYIRKATLVRVIDGDTVVLTFDLGFCIFHEAKARLLGINAPELHGTTQAKGEAARQHLEHLLHKHGPELLCRTVKDRTDKYGRYLVTILGRDGRTDINALMLADGHAAPLVM